MQKGAGLHQASALLQSDTAQSLMAQQRLVGQEILQRRVHLVVAISYRPGGIAEQVSAGQGQVLLTV